VGGGGIHCADAWITDIEELFVTPEDEEFDRIEREAHYKEVIGGVQKLFSDRRLAVPDAMTMADGENASYTEGWNDCRALMLEMRKP
jgi:hypothetical protein